MLLYATVVLVSLAVTTTAIPANSYQVIITAKDGQQPSVFSGALVAENMILTSAQNVFHRAASALRIRSFQSPPGKTHNISTTYIHSDFNPATMYPDFALLQLQNGSQLVAERMQPVPIDWQCSHWNDCTVSFPRNGTDGLTQTLTFADIHRVCQRFGSRNLTTCTTYTLKDPALCRSPSLELNIDRGTPLVCGGQLSGFVSNIVHGVAAHPNDPCPMNATAYYSRVDPKSREWTKQVMNRNRPNAPHISARPETTHVTHWSGTGTFARPAPLGGVQQPATGQQHPVHATQPQQAGKKGRRNGAGDKRGSTPGVVLGLMMFAVLRYV